MPQRPALSRHAAQALHGLVSRHASNAGPCWPSNRIAALQCLPRRAVWAAACASRCAPMASYSLRYLVRVVTLAAGGLLALACALPVHAHPNAAADNSATHGASEAALPPETPYPRQRITIGDGTNHLLDLQRNAPATHPRPIDGEQASRSYQRYLRSFETDIPEHYHDSGGSLLDLGGR